MQEQNTPLEQEGLYQQNPQSESSKDIGQPTIATLLRKGMLLALPIVLYLGIIYVVLGLVFRLLTPISVLVAGSTEITWYTQLFTIILVLVIFLLLGYLTRFQSLRLWANTIESQYLFKAPLYVPVRDTVQQFSGLKKMPFSQVVLVDPYGNGVLLTGFVSEEVTPNFYTIFVPTAPNPLNGNIYHVPKSKLIFLPISTEVAMRSIVGMGSGSSILFGQQAGSEILSPAVEFKQ